MPTVTSMRSVPPWQSWASPSGWCGEAGEGECDGIFLPDPRKWFSTRPRLFTEIIMPSFRAFLVVCPLVALLLPTLAPAQEKKKTIEHIAQEAKESIAVILNTG